MNKLKFAIDFTIVNHALVLRLLMSLQRDTSRTHNPTFP
jgi:hypothetical protein